MLWEYLKNLASSIILLWVVLRDFNEMLAEDEKMGGLPLNGNTISTFRDCIDQCGLMDLGFHGPRYMWTNKILIWHHNVKERLSRGLGNVEWKFISPKKKKKKKIIIFLVDRPQTE